MRQTKWIVVLCVLFVAACTHTIDVPTKNERLVYMYSIYNAQHEQYVRMADDPNTTEAQKVIMRKKKPILEALQLLIPAYDQTVQMGTPSYEQEQQIYDLLNELQQLVEV